LAGTGAGVATEPGAGVASAVEAGAPPVAVIEVEAGPRAEVEAGGDFAGVGIGAEAGFAAAT